jgi:hypothetical protein
VAPDADVDDTSGLRAEPELEPEPEAPPVVEPAAEEDVSIESILEDLKRREGRGE